MGKSRRHHEDHDEHGGGHERWLITYADMVTLLMVLFIVMFAISQVDQKRFLMLKEGRAVGIGQNATPFSGETSVLDAQGSQAVSAIAPDSEGLDPISQDQQPDVALAAAHAEAQQAAAQSAGRNAYDEARAELIRLENLRKLIHRALAAKGFAGDVKLTVDARGLRISLVSRHIVFAANMADLSERGQRLLDVLAPVLRTLDNQIEVDGHTNQVKVKPKYFPTDWELSAARAVTVLRYLDERGRVPATRMSAAAFGHERPIVDPKLPGSQELNKRVDVVVISGASEAARNLFEDVKRERAAG